MEFEGLKPGCEPPDIHNLWISVLDDDLRGFPTGLREPFIEALDGIATIWGTPDQRWPLLRTGERPPISPLVRRLVLDRDNYRCTVCSARPRGLHLDHVIPWSANGPDTTLNLRALCEAHNEDRSNFLEAYLPRVLPATTVCDPCLLVHDQFRSNTHEGRRHHWAIELAAAPFGCPICSCGEHQPGPSRRQAYCATCTVTSWVSRPERLP